MNVHAWVDFIDSKVKENELEMSVIQDVAYFIYDVSRTIVGVRYRNGKLEVFFEKPAESGAIDERLKKLTWQKVLWSKASAQSTS